MTERLKVMTIFGTRPEAIKNGTSCIRVAKASREN